MPRLVVREEEAGRLLEAQYDGAPLGSIANTRVPLEHPQDVAFPDGARQVSHVRLIAMPDYLAKPGWMFAEGGEAVSLNEAADFATMTVVELREFAAVNDVVLGTARRKSEIIDILATAL